MLSPELAAGNMIRANGLALRKFDGRDGPLAIVAPDRDSQTVMLVKPDRLHGPAFPSVRITALPTGSDRASSSTKDR
jgi:hypothetical protein